MPGTSFDRVADIYDETRGGQRRGNRFAECIAPWVTGTRVVELGGGTGVIAVGLKCHGLDLVGFDLSLSMMRSAVDPLGPQVAEAPPVFGWSTVTSPPGTSSKIRQPFRLE